MWIREARERLGLTQEGLTKRLSKLGYNVTRGAISNWERVAPPLDDANLREALSMALGMTEAQMLELAGYEVAGYKARHSEAGEQAANMIDQMTLEKQRKALIVLRKMAESDDVIIIT